MTHFNIRPYQNSDFHVLLELFFDAVHAIEQTYYTAQQLNAWAPPLNTWSNDTKKQWQERLERNYTLVLLRQDATNLQKYAEQNNLSMNQDHTLTTQEEKIASIKASEQIIGFGNIFLDSKLNQVIVDHLFIHPQYKNMGLGSALLVELENYALKNWHTEYIVTKAANNARLFFSSHGYKVMDTNIVNRHGVKLQNYTMQKLLGC